MSKSIFNSNRLQIMAGKLGGQATRIALIRQTVDEINSVTCEELDQLEDFVEKMTDLSNALEETERMIKEAIEFIPTTEDPRTQVMPPTPPNPS